MGLQVYLLMPYGFKAHNSGLELLISFVYFSGITGNLNSNDAICF